MNVKFLLVSLLYACIFQKFMEGPYNAHTGSTKYTQWVQERETPHEVENEK